MKLPNRNASNAQLPCRLLIIQTDQYFGIGAKLCRVVKICIKLGDLRAAKALGLTVPRVLQAAADEVIN